MESYRLIALYLATIVLANLLLVEFGPRAAVINCFILVGFDLVVRDELHQRWQGRTLWWRMLILIGAGSCLTLLLNHHAGRIAFASFIAFTGAGIVDSISYQLLGKRAFLLKVNGSNVLSAFTDSVLFVWVAFGFPLLWPLIIYQCLMKIFGGAVWSLLWQRFGLRQKHS